ncbi:MAG: sulfhydrogenase subunit delta [Gammaproteobacteria bacterium]|nr:sulfhydrogenase subunit delta [Gammaproteobacteria bacterium]
MDAKPLPKSDDGPVTGRPTVAVHKFTSCDGCQLAFLNLGDDLLTLAGLVDIRHFAEAGMVDPEAQVDIAFVEGSITTPDEYERIRRIRASSRFLVALGACATAGGLQALRNLNGLTQEWMAGIYATPAYIRTLETSTAISTHVKVDLELWGCPVNGRQVLGAVRALLFGVLPEREHDKVCLECKRERAVCVMVARGIPCMGPVTLSGCGALCPRFGRDCYACYGPAENANTAALGRRLAGLGLPPEAAAHRFHFINNGAPAFLEAGRRAAEGGFDDG